MLSRWVAPLPKLLSVLHPRSLCGGPQTTAAAAVAAVFNSSLIAAMRRAGGGADAAGTPSSSSAGGDPTIAPIPGTTLGLLQVSGVPLGPKHR